ncbi:MAG: hypothetical protein PHD02_01890 [Bacilli bacterium]|nr:hypothetical protein [Bacilli bacterium]
MNNTEQVLTEIIAKNLNLESSSPKVKDIVTLIIGFGLSANMETIQKGIGSNNSITLDGTPVTIKKDGAPDLKISISFKKDNIKNTIIISYNNNHTGFQELKITEEFYDNKEEVKRIKTGYFPYTTGTQHGYIHVYTAEELRLISNNTSGVAEQYNTTPLEANLSLEEIIVRHKQIKEQTKTY